MSEQVPAEPIAAPVEPSTQGDPAEDKPLGPGGEKALAAEREARKGLEKAHAELTAKLKQIEDSQLGDLERAQKEASEAKGELARITKENVRNKVALAKSVPADLLDFLTGDTEDEIAAKADVLMARLNAPTTPRPDPSQGPSGSALALNGDPLLNDLKNKLGIV